MNKTKVAFHTLSGLFALAMAGSAMAKLSQQQALVQSMAELGYPLYMLKILGVSYLVGAIAILQPKFKTLQQWGYAGFTLALVSAAGSHLLAGQALSSAVPALVFLALLAAVITLKQRLEQA